MIGDGRSVRFGEDVWCSEDPLCVTFPTLDALDDSKGAWVSEVWESLGQEGGFGLL